MQDWGCRGQGFIIEALSTATANPHPKQVLRQMRWRVCKARGLRFQGFYPSHASRILHPRQHTLASNQINPSSQRLTALRPPSGDHTGKETPVPIPNTAVKLSGPMIVPTSAKVGIARFYFRKPRRLNRVERG